MLEGMDTAPTSSHARGRLIAAAVLALLVAPAPRAAVVGWAAAGNGAWSAPANWGGGALPGPASFVEIGTPAFPFAGTVSSTQPGNVAAELDLGPAPTLAVSAGILAVGGTVDSAGKLTVSGGAVLDAGRLFNRAGGMASATGAGTRIDIGGGVFSDGVLVLEDGAGLATGFPDGSVYSTGTLTVKVPIK